MHYFVTGGTGFLGLHLIRLLISRGDRVTALIYEPDREEVIRDIGATTVVGGFHDDAMRDAMRGCDAVFHVAGYVSLNDPTADQSWQTNVDGTQAVCAAALEAGVPRLVHSSSLVTIGGTREGRVLDESSRFNLDHLTLPYITSKRAAERIAIDYNKRGLEVIVCNPSGLIGPDDRWGSAANVIFPMYLRNRIRLLPHVRNNWGDVRDVAIGHTLAMQHGRPGQRYFLGCENTSLLDLLQRLDQCDGASARWRFCLPDTLNFLAGAAVDFCGLKAPLSRDAARFMRHAFWVSHAKATNELGFQPRPIEQTLADTLRWFQGEAVSA